MYQTEEEKRFNRFIATYAILLTIAFVAFVFWQHNLIAKVKRYVR